MPGPLSVRIVRGLVRWYRRHRRDLPWRKTRDPYRIWISEVLLQQTQVDTVLPYYKRFLDRFPTVNDLAAAPLSAVLKAWEGCGYYARARNLHRAAREIADSGGILPRTAGGLIRLPGIGKYTSAAIASIAFGEAAPAIDGNVERVLSRLLKERRILKTPAVSKRLHRAAASIMDAAVKACLYPGDVNQSLMELGALLCRPASAGCKRCPLRSECRAALKLEDPAALPKRAERQRTPHYDVGAAIIRKKGRILIARRPEEGLLGGLWEFPGGKRREGETMEACVRREITEELGIPIEVGERLISVRHAYSHFRITLHAYECRQTGGRVRNLGVAESRWVRPGELDRFAFPKADRVILEKLKSMKR